MFEIKVKILSAQLNKDFIMAGVAESVRKSLADYELGELDFAMMHACMAVDGTSKKLFPDMRKHSHRFTRVLRENYDIIGPMGMPGINLETTRWPVIIGDNKEPDVADLIYSIHRCSHGHGDDLPNGFELIREANNGTKRVTTLIEPGKVRLSDCMIFALLAIAVTSPVNEGLRAPESNFLSFNGAEFLINDLWGRRDYFVSAIQTLSMPSITLDLGRLQELK
jgi:hypothetical protein